MKTKIQRWGNSLGIRLPKNITEQKSLREGAGVSVSIKNDQIIIEPVAEDISLESLLSSISKENLHKETNWDRTRGNELW
jgi:antitoxin MazE